MKIVTFNSIFINASLCGLGNLGHLMGPTMFLYVKYCGNTKIMDNKLNWGAILQKVFPSVEFYNILLSPGWKVRSTKNDTIYSFDDPSNESERHFYADYCLLTLSIYHSVPKTALFGLHFE